MLKKIFMSIRKCENVDATGFFAIPKYVLKILFFKIYKKNLYVFVKNSLTSKVKKI